MESVARAFEHADTPLFLVAVEATGRFRFSRVNRAFLRATGLSRSKVEGQRYGEVAVTPVADQRGRVRVLSGVVFDVTARNLARRQARESEAMFSKAFHENPTAMGIRRQRDDTVIAVNRSFERLFGYRSAEVVGRAVEAIGLYPPQARRLALKRRSERAGLLRGVFRTRRKGFSSARSGSSDSTPSSTPRLVERASRSGARAAL